MKPSTKAERECVALSEQLKPLTAKQSARGYALAFYYTGTQYMDGRCFCNECGHQFERKTDMWEVELLQNGGEAPKRKKRPRHVVRPGAKEYTNCPNCHKRLLLQPNGKKTYSYQEAYFSLMDYAGGKYQIVRTFMVGCVKRIGEPVDIYEPKEVAQRYIDIEKAKVACDIARPINGLAMNRYSSIIPWKWDKPMSIKGQYQYAYEDRYDFGVSFIVRKLHPVLKQKGLEKLPWSSYHNIWLLLTNSHAETLLKAGRWEEFKLLNTYGDRIWPQLKICNRHGYKIKDGSLWKDTIDMVRRLHLDDHSPKYICPDNLKRLHDTLHRRIERIEAEERRRREEAELQENLKKARKSEMAYKQFIKPFAGIKLHGKNLTIAPLLSVADFAEEGHAMHHCVYSMGYYRHRDRLILSARDGKDNRLATIEYRLKTGIIEQCRAVCNGVPERDNEIRMLIEKNLPVFFKAYKNYQKQIAQ